MSKTPKSSFSFQNSYFHLKFFFDQNLDFVLGFYVNDEKIKLVGVNRHDMTAYGIPTVEDYQRDLDLLLTAGVNFVRGAHYQQDLRWLDMLDDAGIMVWEEPVSWQATIEELEDGPFVARQIKLIQSMIESSGNHPCIIVWGFLNEAASEWEEAGNAYATLSQAVKSRDESRLITWATNKGQYDQHVSKYADFVSINDYSGWYWHTLADVPKVWQSFARWARSNGQVAIISEVGAGSIPEDAYESAIAAGLNNTLAPCTKWTESYQSMVVQVQTITVLWDSEDSDVHSMHGITHWQFTDTYTNHDHYTPDKRPRGLNNKGLVTIRRQPKRAFHEFGRLVKSWRAGETPTLRVPSDCDLDGNPDLKGLTDAFFVPVQFEQTVVCSDPTQCVLEE